LRRHELAVQATVSATGDQQAAVSGFAVSDALKLIFDTLAETRKAMNLRARPAIGWDEEQTLIRYQENRRVERNEHIITPAARCATVCMMSSRWAQRRR
jgi:hypothetical protein